MEFRKIIYMDAVCYVSREGTIKTTDGKIKEWYFNADGYPCVSLKTSKGYRSVGVHRLVAIAFVPNPFNKKEVNHKDFDRTNPKADNLEWMSHNENIEYSYKAGKYKGRCGELNSNFNHHTLHEKYMNDKNLSLLKQSRPGGQNGRAKKCCLYFRYNKIQEFDCQRDAFHYLVDNNVCVSSQNPESVIRYLKSSKGYKQYYLVLI